jgi:hypothetical protein
MDYFEKEKKMTEPSFIPHMTIHVIRNAYKQAMSKTTSSLCHGLIDSIRFIKAKWEKELNIDISEEDWDNICSTQHTVHSKSIQTP